MLIRSLLLFVAVAGCSSEVMRRRITVREEPEKVRREFSSYAEQLGEKVERMPVYRKSTQPGMFGPVRTEEEIPEEKAPLVLGFRHGKFGFVLRESAGAMVAEVERSKGVVDPAQAEDDLDYVARDLAAFFATRFGDAVEGPKPAR